MQDIVNCKNIQERLDTIVPYSEYDNYVSIIENEVKVYA